MAFDRVTAVFTFVDWLIGFSHMEREKSLVLLLRTLIKITKNPLRSLAAKLDGADYRRSSYANASSLQRSINPGRYRAHAFARRFRGPIRASC